MRSTVDFILFFWLDTKHNNSNFQSTLNESLFSLEQRQVWTCEEVNKSEEFLSMKEKVKSGSEWDIWWQNSELTFRLETVLMKALSGAGIQRSVLDLRRSCFLVIPRCRWRRLGSPCKNYINTIISDQPPHIAPFLMVWIWRKFMKGENYINISWLMRRT